MSRRRLKARDRITQKMSKNGLIERNNTTKEDIRVSKREADFNIQGDTPENLTLSQHGIRSNIKIKSRKNIVRGQHEHLRQIENTHHESQKNSEILLHESQENLETFSNNTTKQSFKPPYKPHAEQKNRPKKFKVHKNVVYNQHSPVIQHEQSASNISSLKYDSKPNVIQKNGDMPHIQKNSLQQRNGKFKIQRKTKFKQNNSVQKMETEQAADIHDNPRELPKQNKKFKIQKTTVYRQKNTVVLQNNPLKQKIINSDVKISDKLENKTEKQSNKNTSQDLKPKTKDKSNLPIKQNKSGKLKFTNGETGTSEKPKNRKLAKAERQVKQVGKKLEKAKNKLPGKRKLRSERVFDENSGKAKRKLYFEKEIKSQEQHTKGALPLRPIKAGANMAIVKAHSKLYQVEHENVSVKAAHHAEMIAEGGVRSVLRYHKTAPYRKVVKLENQAAKKSVNLTYQKAVAENPKLKSNMFSRMWQKRKIQKDYAKKAREAQKAAKRAKKAGTVTSNAVKTAAVVVKKHPLATILLVLILLLVLMIMSFCSLGGTMSGGLGSILAASYLAEDAEIDMAEIVYTEWETDLERLIINAANDRPGYDEYIYNIENIGHDPYELMAYLTAVYQDFTYDAITGDLQALFDEQYTLVFTETTETRYTEPSDENSEPEPYEWKILTVTLTVKPFYQIFSERLNTEQLQHYYILMTTNGNRQYAGSPFDFNWLPYVSSNYGWRVHPIIGDKDLHLGVDIALPEGTEILSAQSGTVTFAGESGDYGNVVIIENDSGIITKYAHCNSMFVNEGQIVNAGDIIATVGSTGLSTGTHLHYEILKDGEYRNPLYFTDTGR